MKIAILGHGVFGEAISTHLLRLGHSIQIEEVADAELIFVCVPSFAVLPVLLNNKEKITDQKIIICSKGFSEDGRLLSEVVSSQFTNNIYFLYGPTIADEIKRGILSGMVLAGGEGKEEIKQNIESSNLIIELSEDVVGVQIGAAMKNAITIFVGIAEGASYGQNTQAYIFTKGLKEIQKMGVLLGADPNTFTGLTCMGDLTLRSRNRLLGVELGKGRKFDDIRALMEYPQEGIATIKNSRLISKRIGVDLLFIDTLHAIIFDNLSIDEGIKRII